MKKYFGYLVLVITLLNSGCDKCIEGDIGTPASLFIEVVDETTLVNVFEDESFTAQQISIKDLDEKLIPFIFVPNSNLIRIFPNTQNLIGNTFIITLNNETTAIMKQITITHDVEAVSQECYITYEIKNVQVPNNSVAVINEIFQIKI